MKLVVGLGNIGDQYANTRHNVGFMILDQLAQDLGTDWQTETKHHADVAIVQLDGEKLILAKPRTMMNLSGEAIGSLMRFYKIDPANVWIVFDDVDVPFGKVRLRTQGSAGGHQGIRSMISHIGAEFIRLRIGISLNDRTREPSEVYVLKPFNADERQALPQLIPAAAHLVREQLALGQPEEATFVLIP